MSDLLQIRYAPDRGHDPFWPPAVLKPVEATLEFEGLPIGTLTGTLVRGGIITRTGDDPLTELSAESEELQTVALAIFTEDTGRRYQDSFKAFVKPRGMNILYLSRLTITAGFRGHRLGLALIQYVLTDIPHDVAIIKPYPLQHESRGKRAKTPALIEYAKVPVKRATAKLFEHYAKLGFQPMPPLMARSAPEKHDFIDFDEPNDDAIASMRLASDEVGATIMAKHQERSNKLNAPLITAALDAISKGDRKARNSILTILERD